MIKMDIKGAIVQISFQPRLSNNIILNNKNSNENKCCSYQKLAGLKNDTVNFGALSNTLVQEMFSEIEAAKCIKYFDSLQPYSSGKLSVYTGRKRYNLNEVRPKSVRPLIEVSRSLTIDYPQKRVQNLSRLEFVECEKQLRKVIERKILSLHDYPEFLDLNSLMQYLDKSVKKGKVKFENVGVDNLEKIVSFDMGNERQVNLIEKRKYAGIPPELIVHFPNEILEHNLKITNKDTAKLFNRILEICDSNNVSAVQ